MRNGFTVGKYQHHDGCGCESCAAQRKALRDAVYDAAVALHQGRQLIYGDPLSAVLSITAPRALVEAWLSACRKAEEVERG